mgnify:CR=1 FL=1
MSHLLNADLHCHSVVSDGTLEPEALAQRAKANGVELWALTDHDEVDGQRRAADAARRLGLDYLSGCEISVSFIGVTVSVAALALAHWGVPRATIEVTGIPIHPVFAREKPRAECVTKHELSDARPVVLLLAGGEVTLQPAAAGDDCAAVNAL